MNPHSTLAAAVTATVNAAAATAAGQAQSAADTAAQAVSASHWPQLPQHWPAQGDLLTWPLMKYTVAIMGGIFGMLLGGSIWRAAGLDPVYAWSGGLTGLIFFGMLSFMVFRGSIMMFMSLQGSVMLVFGVLGLIYKYQDIAPKVTENLTAKSFVLPLIIFVPATLGLIWQQTHYGGGPPAAAAKK